MPSTKVCKVCIPNTARNLYDYTFDLEHPPVLGGRVWVPFRKTHMLGVVFAFAESDLAPEKLRSIVLMDDSPLFNSDYRAFCQWLSDYYHIPLSEILALALPKLLKDFNCDLSLPYQSFYRLKSYSPEEWAKLRSKKLQSFLKFLVNQPDGVDRKTLTAQGFSRAICQRAEELAWVEKEERPLALTTLPPSQIILNTEQQQAVAALNLGQFGVYVLNGVTGSGKTEVYIEWMRSVLAKGQQILFLVPEIGLTSTLLERLQSRLGVPAVLLHSELSDKQRFAHWLQAYHQAAKLIVGTRSAIFANLTQLGLIVIDEEHDLSFRQMEGLRYSAKDAAIMRAKLLNIPIVLGTATPCLETLHNLNKAKYQGIYLRQKALNQTPLYFQMVDLRQQKMPHGLADKTLAKIAEHLEKSQQVLVFINRRGYAPLLFCHACAWTKRCRDCDANMTWHFGRQRLICHHCGFELRLPTCCEACGGRDLLPMGVGTERLFEFLSQTFPQYRCLRFDRDVVKNRHQLETALAQIHQQEVDLIVGTQMLTKGHHFSNLSLVVVVDADSAFYQSDFRALERLGQILTQVSGRTGRAELAGEVVIQTHLPQHPMLLTLLQQGYAPFAKALLDEREMAGFPPYAFMGICRLQGRHSAQLRDYLQGMIAACQFPGCQVLGPAPAPMEKKATFYRWHLVLKAKQRQHLHQAIQALEQYILQHPPKGMRYFIELDPYDF